MTRVHRALALLLRTLGAIDVIALAVPLLPQEMIDWCHAQAGLGTFPDEPIARYLARTASITYAMHGLVVVFTSFDLPRYWPLIRLLGIAAIVQGALTVMIDLRVGMPLWWTLIEGPCFAGLGVASLVLQWVAGEPRRELPRIEPCRAD